MKNIHHDKRMSINYVKFQKRKVQTLWEKTKLYTEIKLNSQVMPLFLCISSSFKWVSCLQRKAPIGGSGVVGKIATNVVVLNHHQQWLSDMWHQLSELLKITVQQQHFIDQSHPQTLQMYMKDPWWNVICHRYKQIMTSFNKYLCVW